MKRALITGGAGFIGSTLADRLLAEGVEVVVYDNFNTGRREFVEQLEHVSGASVVEGDVLDQPALETALEGCDTVFHLAANADVRHGLEHPRRDLEQNTVGTANVLEAMRSNDVKRIVFSSTGSIYGEPELFPTPEDCPFPLQTSLYGASKLAGEGMIEAYCHGYGFTAAIFRFVSILGERYTHGHVFDFYRRLREDPSKLTVLGDGKQEKSYLYVQDCVAGLIRSLEVIQEGTATIFNIGLDETVIVDRSVEIICEAMGVSPTVEHTGGKRGWPGDSPLILLDCERLRSTGWQPTLPIEQSIRRTVEWFDANPWIFEETKETAAS